MSVAKIVLLAIVAVAVLAELWVLFSGKGDTPRPKDDDDIQWF